jgi:hypothetical protein
LYPKEGLNPSFVPPENHFSSKKFLRFLKIVSVKHLSQNKYATPWLRRFLKKDYIFQGLLSTKENYLGNNK